MIFYEIRVGIGRRISITGKTSFQFPMVNLSEKVRQKEFLISRSVLKEMFKTKFRIIMNQKDNCL